MNGHAITQSSEGYYPPLNFINSPPSNKQLTLTHTPKANALDIAIKIHPPSQVKWSCSHIYSQQLSFHFNKILASHNLVFSLYYQVL